jgi:hypothetical protein
MEQLPLSHLNYRHFRELTALQLSRERTGQRVCGGGGGRGEETLCDVSQVYFP